MIVRYVMCSLVLALPVQAQDTGSPLSAIDWLSQSVAAPALPEQGVTFDPSGEEPVAQSGASPTVTTTSLDTPTYDTIGLLSSEVTGLPRSLWSRSQEATLVDLLNATSVEALPAIQDLLITLLLAEADPALGATGESRLFLARIDKLLDIGALAPAQALIEAAGPDTPALYRRWFDISLLTGTEDDACEAQREQPALDTTYPARIFCLARTGDWTAAALTLNTGRALEDVSPEEDELLSWFLDPELQEGTPNLAPPSRSSPLVFRMREAIGQPLPTASLPRAFANADLRTTVAWRYHIAAAERLISTGAISENILFSHYVADTPSASGGVWDRARDIQALEAALDVEDGAEIAETLGDAWAVVRSIDAEVAFARYYGPRLRLASTDAITSDLIHRISLLLPEGRSAFAQNMTPNTTRETFWRSIATGQVAEISGLSTQERAVLEGLTSDVPPIALQTLISEGKTGEALLRIISLFEQGRSGDLMAISEGLASLRALGLNDTAINAALQYLILGYDR